MGRASFRAAARVGRARCPATDVPDEWSSPAGPSRGGPGQNPAYRPSGRFFHIASPAAISRETRIGMRYPFEIPQKERSVNKILPHSPASFPQLGKTTLMD